jgi:hypothetical protein
MATSQQIILAGIAWLVNTVALIVMAYIGDKVFTPIFLWLNSFQYSTAPPLDPGMLNWVPHLFFGLLVVCWLALGVAVVILILNRQTYSYQTGGW